MNATLAASLGNRRVALMPLLGFASGLPLALTAGTLQAWLTVEGVDIATIGLFSLVGVPYVAKFVWAPGMDRYSVPVLDRRRGWMLAAQPALIAGIAAASPRSPRCPSPGGGLPRGHRTEGPSMAPADQPSAESFGRSLKSAGRRPVP